MGMNTTFGLDIRLLLCPNCAAPMEASTMGGVTRCTYCGFQSQLAARNHAPLKPPGRPPLPEAERRRRLRAQDGKPLVPPPAIQGLLDGGAIASWKIDEAVQIWNTTRQELGAGRGSFQSAEQLLFLTILLANHYSKNQDMARARAMYESALEASTLPRHQQVLRGLLSRAAAREGDLAAAEQWLVPCDPESDDLESDSAYRLSRATIDTARGDFSAVLAILGRTNDEVPIMDAMDPLAAVFRANALERLGQLKEAVAVLKDTLRREGAMGIQYIHQVIERNHPWSLCQQSVALVDPHRGRSRGGDASEAGAKPRGGTKGVVLLGLAYGFMVPTALLLFWISAQLMGGMSLGHLIPFFVIMGVFALVSMGMTFFAILARTSGAGAHILFDTWFPLAMVTVPLAGPFIALVSAYKLLRGRLGAATITTTRGSSRSRAHYDALKLHGSGIPGGIVLILVALVQPLIALPSILVDSKPMASVRKSMRGLLGDKATEMTWAGKGQLRCRGHERYRVENVTVSQRGSMLIRADGHCVVRISKSTITAGGYAAIRLGSDAKVILEASHIKGKDSAIRVEGRATLIVKGGKIEAGSQGIALRAFGHAKVTLTDVTIVGGTALRGDGSSVLNVTKGALLGKTALRVSGHALVTLKETRVVGRVRKYGGGTVVRLKEGQDLKSIVAKRRALALRVDRYRRQACTGFFQCYEDLAYQGPVKVGIVMVIGEDGKVRRVRSRLGRVSRKIERCLRKVAKAKVLKNFDGPAGKLVCAYSGNVMGGTRMLSLSTKYVPSPKSSIHGEKR